MAAEICDERRVSDDESESSEEENDGLDLAFALDCTGSMGSYIEQARDNIRKIVEGIIENDTSVDIRLALVEYRDHPPQDTSFVTRVHDFTSEVPEMKAWLTECSADGGGDTPEAVADALYQVFRLDWRPDSIKICVLITDAPPHGLERSDSFSNGCPDHHDPLRLSRDLAEIGVMIYMVGCQPSITPYVDFFKALAFITGGQYVPLDDAQVLSHVIIGGAQEEISLEQFKPDVDGAVKQELEQNGTNIDEDSLSQKLYDKLKEKGAKVLQLQKNNSCLVTVNEKVKKYSNCADMCDARELRGNSRRGRGGGRGRSRGGRGRGGRGRGRGRGRRRDPCDDWGSADDGWDGDSASGPQAPDTELSEAYAAIEAEINLDQVSRMVQKSVAQNRALLGLNK